MSNEKRLVLFMVVTFLSILALQQVMILTGLEKPPEPAKAPGALAKNDVAKNAKGETPPKASATPAEEKKTDEANPRSDAAPASDDARPTEPPAIEQPSIAKADPSELILGSTKNEGPGGYRLAVQLEQQGAGVESLASSQFEAEFEQGQPRHRPLQLLKRDPLWPPSLAMTLVNARIAGTEAAAAVVLDPNGGEIPLDEVLWEVVREEGQPAVRSIKKENSEGQELAFRTRIDSLGLTITRTYRLFKGQDGFELDMTFANEEKSGAVTYKLLGPHGIPIEGEWYTGTFREAFFAHGDAANTKIISLTADSIAKRKDDPEKIQPPQPLKYAGVENQYFAVFFEPFPLPTNEARWDAEARPILLHESPERQKSDIGVELISRPIMVGPNTPVTHTYRVFAGPKTLTALTPFAADDLAFSKSSWIPGASSLARGVITPLLGQMYDLTRTVSGWFGATRGNYGVAIILLTLLVRMLMFPLGRKQALAAKKMQDLQPYLKEIQEKYKDDKEAQTRETWALWRKHGVNPAGGCWPALIQLPIFVGLWQALNNSVSLRHASFLYINNLAAPDMLFRFPTTLPFLGDYFNVLPFLVVALMLVQTQLFSPPATTPEAEMQQKTMKFMMVIMAFMFYKVPSGLGLYFITSSLWQIGERLLLPKVSTAPVTTSTDDDNPPGGRGRGGGGGGGGGGKGGGNGTSGKPPGRFAQFMEKVLEEAQKQKTYRNESDDRNRGRNQPRAKPGRRK